MLTRNDTTPRIASCRPAGGGFPRVIHTAPERKCSTLPVRAILKGFAPALRKY